MDNQYKNINFKELCNELGPEFIQKMNEVQTKEDEQDLIVNECPHVPKLAKFKPPRCPIGVYWNTLCLMRDVWTIKTYMI